MKYNFILFGIFIAAHSAIGMENSSKLPEKDIRELINESQKDWKNETKRILKDTTRKTQTSCIFARYTSLFVNRAEKLYQSGKTIDQIMPEMRRTYPRSSELSIILTNKLSWKIWFQSFSADPISIKEWNEQVPLLENLLAEEQYHLDNPYEYYPEDSVIK